MHPVDLRWLEREIRPARGFFSVVLVAILFLYATMRASLKLLPRVSYVNVARFLS